MLFATLGILVLRGVAGAAYLLQPAPPPPPGTLSIDELTHNASQAMARVDSTDMSGHLTARDVTTGAVVAKLPLGAPSWGGVSIAGGYVFAVTGTQGTSGYVVAYRPRG